MAKQLRAEWEGHAVVVERVVGFASDVTVLYIDNRKVDERKAIVGDNSVRGTIGDKPVTLHWNISFWGFLWGFGAGQSYELQIDGTHVELN